MAGQNDIWKKRVLLPLWIVQLIGLVVFLGLSALSLFVLKRMSDGVEDEDPDFAEDLDDAIDTGAAINLAFSIFTILMVFAEMVLFCTHRLKPVANLVMQCLKSAIWTFYLIVTIIAAAQGASSGFVIFLVLVIFLTCIGLLAYGATLVHRKRKGTLSRGNYASPSDASRFEPSRYSNQTTGYAGVPNPNPFRDPSPAPYNPQATHPAHRPSGEANEYYGGAGSYEMQHGAGK